MKKYVILMLAALSSMLLVSCADSPSEVAEKFSHAIATGQVDEAKKYCTESTAKVLDMSAALGGLTENPNYKMNILRDSVVDNLAYVFFTEDDSTSVVQVMKLNKIDGEWKVSMNGGK
ncbi:MAG: DUF4878 domain-containing protein [Paludibacteraceae bacterium]|nr:DUF4878 domain-containing protein [Paludibacteraceae bacterium]